MITRTNKIKCNDCGRFIGFKDLADGTARSILYEPDSDRSRETFYSQCGQCQIKEKAVA